MHTILPEILQIPGAILNGKITFGKKNFETWFSFFFFSQGLLAWISSDYLESLFTSQLRGEKI